MTKYTKEKKEHALRLLSPPENLPVSEVSTRTGVTEATLYLWRRQAREQGRVVPGDGQNPEQWSAADKFAVVLESASLAEAELAQYCRRKGLLVEQVRRWQAVAQAGLSKSEEKCSASERAQDRKRLRELEKDLRRKERALAETAALLVLSRKYEALRTESEGA